MKINHNMSAILSNNKLKVSEKGLSNSIQKLSSGYKVNSSKDNPAGLAISQKMSAQIRGLDRASQNALDGVSAIETAEGELNEVHSMLQRMRELSVQASNDTYTLEDREAMQAEVDQLKEEIDRLAKDTQFNGQALLDGSYDVRSYANSDGVKIRNVGDNVLAGNYQMEVTGLASKATASLTLPTTVQDDGVFVINGVEVELSKGDNQLTMQKKIRDAADAADVSVTFNGTAINFEAKEYGSKQKMDIGWSDELIGTFGTVAGSLTKQDGTDVQVNLIRQNGTASIFSATATAIGDGKDVTITDKSGFSMTVQVDQELYAERKGLKDAQGNLDTTGVTAASFGENGTLTINVKDYGSMVLQIGTSEGQTTNVRIPQINCDNLGLNSVNLLSHDLATSSITDIDNAISSISSVRSSLGAMQNRLEHTQTSLDTTQEAVTSAMSRIMDTDVAEEMATYTQYNVLQQAGISVLAQANDLPQQALQLLN